MTDWLLAALTYHDPVLAAACLTLGVLGALAVVALDRAEARLVARSHEPMGGEDG